MLVTSKKLLLDAQKGAYAVGAFNTSDLEITKAIIAAAVRLKSPVIIQTSEKAIAFAGLENLACLVKNEAGKIKVSVALHLDHGKSLELIADSLCVGYTSIMFDGSHLPLRENIIFTKQAVGAAHRHNVPCEGELGSIGNPEEEAQFTDAGLVKEYIAKTGVDSLAVAIGSRHATEIEALNIDLLKKIRRLTNTPLVLHGASGVPDSEVKKAIKNGICKVNIDTDIRHTFSRAVREISQKYKDADPRELMTKVMLEVQLLVEEKMKLFGSDGKG
jgi:ketose-bisphosphate aldolase